MLATAHLCCPQGDLLNLLGRWCASFELDEVCRFFAVHVLRARDGTSPYVKEDGPRLPVVLREMVLAFCEEKKRPIGTVVIPCNPAH
jgi:hypothetical protein